MGNGLEVMLDIQQDEYLPIWRETSKSPKMYPPPPLPTLPRRGPRSGRCVCEPGPCRVLPSSYVMHF